jgi:hypothetical protein
MFTSEFSIDRLIRSTLKTDDDRVYVQYSTITEFREAIVKLDQAGITQAQIQLLQHKPFSRFVERDYQEVMLIALAIRKGTATVAQIHRCIQEREYQARIYGRTTVIQTEQLPGIEMINGYLGLSKQAE